VYNAETTKGLVNLMRMTAEKLELSKDEFEEIAKAQDRAFEMVKNHLAEPLKKIEAMGYSRLELACAYLALAYHALRYGRSKEKAEKNFLPLAYLACKRVEENFKYHRAKRLN
jgi:hypothetical protein